MISFVISTRDRLKQSPMARRFLDGAVWSVLGSLLSSAVTLIMLMVVARLLGKEVYGQFIIIQSTLSMTGVFAGVGIGAAATRYAAELKLSNTERLGHILTLSERTIISFGLLGTIGLVFASDWLAANILNAPTLSMPLAISACAVLFTALDSYQKSVLIGFEAIRAYAIGTVFGTLMGLPIMLLAADNFGLNGVAVAIPVNAIIQACISRYQMLRLLNKYLVQRNVGGCTIELPVLWKFAFPALLSGAMVGPAHWVTQALLANSPNGYAELATMGIIMQWFNVIMFVPGTASRVVLPILTDRMTKNDHGGSRKILLLSMFSNSVMAVPLALIVAIFSPHIMSMYGDSFENEALPLILSVITAALVAIQTPVGNLLAASSRMWLGALMNAGWAFAYIIFAYLLVNMGATGIMIALCGAYIIHNFWVGYFAINELGKI